MTIINITTATERKKLIQQRISEVSNGVLNDFDPTSTLNLISEVFALGLVETETWINEQFDLKIQNAILRLFGVSESEGSRAKVELVFSPANFDLLNSFNIDSGQVVTINEKGFVTDSTLTVPPGSLNAKVLATAIEPGSISDLTLNSQVSWGYIPNLANIAVSQVIDRGLNPQTIDSISATIFDTLANRSLIKAENYVYVAKSILGSSFYFRSVPNLDKNGTSYELGTMHIFSLSSSYTPISESQKSTLLSNLSAGFATVYFSDLSPIPVEVHAVISLDPTVNLEVYQGAAISLINDFLIAVFDRSDQEFRLYDLIGAIYKMSGVLNVSSLTVSDDNTGITKAENFPIRVNQIPRLDKLRLTLNNKLFTWSS